METFVQQSQTVYKHIKPYISKTPLIRSDYYSNKYKKNIFFKLENLQHSHSFKARGAVSKLFHVFDGSLSRDANKKKNLKGLVAASGGNHALGLCYAASLIDNIEPHIFLFDSVSKYRQNLIKQTGGVLHVKGVDWNESNENAKLMVQSDPDSYIMVHPFDDPYVILGQSTVGLEITEQMNQDFPDTELDAVVCSIGGGGLIAGISTYIKEHSMGKTKMFGVETNGSKSMYESFRNDKVTMIEKIETICEGLGARSPSELTFQHVKKNVDDCFLVSDKDAMNSLRELLQNDKLFAEPSTTCSLAALDQIFEKNPQLENVCVVICGGNFEIERISLFQE